MSEAEKNLRECQRQLDMDGCFVGVSRQALDETLDELTALRARVPELKREYDQMYTAAQDEAIARREAEARVQELNSIGMSLAADVLSELVLDESQQADRIRKRITQWRRQWDEISARAALTEKPR